MKLRWQDGLQRMMCLQQLGPPVQSCWLGGRLQQHLHLIVWLYLQLLMKLQWQDGLQRLMCLQQLGPLVQSCWQDGRLKQRLHLIVWLYLQLLMNLQWQDGRLQQCLQILILYLK